MTKNKKRKTQHHTTINGTSNTGELSHEQIWDDSALLRSWNDALAEYEFYHSIHAREEDVDEVLRRVEAEEAAEVFKVLNELDDDGGQAIVDAGQVEEGEIDDIGDEGEVDEGAVKTSTIKEMGADQRSQIEKPAHTATDDKAGSVSGDAVLENIKMAYYWAGYYSGLYDGQRRLQDEKGNS